MHSPDPILKSAARRAKAARASDRAACIAMLRHHANLADPAWRQSIVDALRPPPPEPLPPPPPPEPEPAPAPPPPLRESDQSPIEPEPTEPHIPRLAEIIAEVAAKYGLTPLDIRCASRAKVLVRPRHEYFWRAASETLHSLPSIGKHCGGRDHTTVIFGIRAHCRRTGAALPRGMKPWRRPI